MYRYKDALNGLRMHADASMLQLIDAANHYLEFGHESSKRLVLAGKQQFTWWLGTLIGQLNSVQHVDEFDRRLLVLLAAYDDGDRDGLESLASHWNLTKQENFTVAIAELEQAGFTAGQLDVLMVRWLEPGNDLSPMGQYLLALVPARLQKALDVISKVRGLRGHGVHLLQLFVTHGSDRQELIFSAVRKALGPDQLCLILLNLFGIQFETMAASAFEKGGDFDLGMKLVELDRAKYGPSLAKRLPAFFAEGGFWRTNDILQKLGPFAVDAFVAVLLDAKSWGQLQAKVILAGIVDYGRERARPALLEVMESSPSAIARATALQHLLALKDPALADRLESAIERGLEGDPRDAARFAVLAAQFAGGRLRDRLWQDLSAKSKIRRDAAAQAIAEGDLEALDRAAAMLLDKSKESRWGAVTVLTRLGTPSAIECLLNWLSREPTEDIRDEIARSLRQAGVGVEAIARQLGPVDLGKLREQGAKLGHPPVKWISDNDLPPVRMIDGEPLDLALVHFLLHRQSRQKEPIIDPEAAPLYGLIDRRTSGDFAFKLLNVYLESEVGKPGTWAMIVAGVLGDNRVITTLTTKVRLWAQEGSQRLGEWGVASLALNGSDAALSAVDSITTKFKDNPRRKFAVIAEAAQNAMELTAKRLGLSLDDLGDRIVPTLGFEPGRPRRIEAGKRTIEAVIGLDFKLSMTDVATGKRAVSIPKTAAPEVVAQFKGLGKLLVEVSKSQACRLENLMVRQHRWTGKGWQELFLRHPILFPFAVRLVWGTYDAQGNVLQTFRALPDRSLTDANDESIEPPADMAAVGLCHPLELTTEQIAAWQTHLSDYEIESPFPQVDRTVMRVSDHQRDQKLCDEFKGVKLNALGFRSKVERCGWGRGRSDGAVISSYRKRFTTLGIEAFVTTDGLPAYMDPAAQVTIGSVLFLPIDTTPREFESSLMRLGEVPAMAFSEAIGDMSRTCGRVGNKELVIDHLKAEQ